MGATDVDTVDVGVVVKLFVGTVQDRLLLDVGHEFVDEVLALLHGRCTDSVNDVVCFFIVPGGYEV